MPPARRLVRRQPLWERVRAKLNPMDFLLWLSEEIETREWNSKSVGTRAGVAMSFVFFLARANTGGGRSRDVDDVFGDDTGAGWVPYIAQPTVWILVAASIANAWYTMTRVRHYRLFEANIERNPDTPSARRVKVQSEPASSSPLRFLTDIIPHETAESRAHLDKANDVWELSVWDPLPMCLRLFCLFSPGHVLVYMLFVPLAPMDPRPSMTVVNCVVLQVILSTQLLLMYSRFTQHGKDSAIIHREVLNEYDTKFVHPRLHPVVRDAATQIDTIDSGVDGLPDTVSLDSAHGTPTTLLKRGFQTHPNPNYAKHVTSEGAYPNVLSPRLFTPSASSRKPEALGRSLLQHDIRSPALRHSLPAQSTPPRHASPAPAAPQQATSSAFGSSVASTGVGTSAGTNFGGSMGIYTHSRSPLKKATSMGEMQGGAAPSPRNSREMAALEQRGWNRDANASASPSRGGGPGVLGGIGGGGGGGSIGGGGESRRVTTSGQHTRFGRGFQQDRYPSRWA